MEKTKFKQIQSFRLYNLTQDFKHLVILDLRNRTEFLKGFIRHSYNFEIQNLKMEEISDLIQFIQKKDKIALNNEKKEKKKIQHVRRVVLILPSGSESLKYIETLKNLDIERYFNQLAFFNKMEEFIENYKFLVLGFSDKEIEKLKNEKIQNIQDFL